MEDGAFDNFMAQVIIYIMKRGIIIAVIIIFLIGLWYFVINPIFIDRVEINDELPINIDMEEVVSVNENEAPIDEMPEAEVQVSETQEATETQEITETQETVETVEMDEMMESEESEETTTTEEPKTQQITERVEVIQADRFHPASGYARIVYAGEDTYVRYEELSTINGPRLHIYLSKDIEATDFIDLGPIKATDGNINYKVPDGVDIADYPYILHWCVPFNVLFNYAKLL